MTDNILIFFVPRSGSSSLCYSFNKHWDIYSEPLKAWGDNCFDYEDFMKLLNNYNGLCIKTSPHHLPEGYDGDIHKFFDEIYPYFQKVIFLDRLDTLGQEKSYERIWEQNKWKTDWKENLYYQKWKIREILQREKYSHHKLYHYEDFYMGADYHIPFEELGIDMELIDDSYFHESDKYIGNLWHRRMKHGNQIRFKKF